MNSAGGREVPEPDPPCEQPAIAEAHPVMTDVPKDELGARGPSSRAADVPAVGSEPTPAVAAPLDGEPASRTESLPSDQALSKVTAFAPLEIVDVNDLDWKAVLNRASPSSIRSEIRSTVERMEGLLDRADGPGMLFDKFRADPTDKVIKISDFDTEIPLWIIGDLHGDLLALEAALVAMRQPGLQPEKAHLGSCFLAISSMTRVLASKSFSAYLN